MSLSVGSVTVQLTIGSRLLGFPSRLRRTDAQVSGWSADFLKPFFALGLLFIIGAFDLQLSGADLSVVRQQGQGSLISQMIRASFYLIAVLILLTSDRPREIALAAWPIFLLPLLAFASVAWSTWPSFTLRRSVGLFGTVVFGISLVSALSNRDCLILIVRVFVISMALSIVWVFAFPAYGIHQATDAVQGVHVGLWRGIFPHRNFLGGYVAGVTLAFLLIYGRYAFKSVFFRAVAIAITLVCLVGSNSGTGYAIAGGVTLVTFLLCQLALAPVSTRLTLMIMLIAGAGVIALLSAQFFALALWALGKEPDLTGRTEIWYYVLALLDDNPLLGRGYSAGFISIGEGISTMTNYRIESAHNGYLDLLVYFGYVGTTIGVLVLVWLFFDGVRLILTSVKDFAVLNTFPTCIVIFVVAHNFAESSIVAPNTSVPLLLAVAAGWLVRSKMRDLASRKVIQPT